MRQVRIIRISFLICAALTVIAFWSGFYYGSSGTDEVQLVTENTTDIYKESVTEAAGDEVTDTDAVESMTEVSPETYYLRRNGSYLSVYQGDSAEVYFDTGIRVSDLPYALQEAAGEGIAFEDLGELYGFLENYSS
ncbi:MAG: hypothetical protein LUD71_04480 [Clostridiales bacterium]|nr:hypothetical protein [Clostridiales bacterium]